MFNRFLYVLLFAWQSLAVVGGFGTGDNVLGIVALIGAVCLMAMIVLGGREEIKDYSLKSLTVAQAKPLIRFNILFLGFTLSLLGQGILFGTAWYWFLIYPILWLLSGREIWIARGVLKSEARTEVLKVKLDKGESLVEKPRPWVSAPPASKPPSPPSVG